MVCVQERHGLIVELLLNPAEVSAQTVLWLEVNAAGTGNRAV